MRGLAEIDRFVSKFISPSLKVIWVLSRSATTHQLTGGLGIPGPARVAELAYAHGLGPCPERVVGSTPISGTKTAEKRLALSSSQYFALLSIN